MNKLLFLTYLLLLTSSLQGMKPIKTLFTAANELSQSLTYARMQTGAHNTHTWEEIKYTDPRVKNYVLQTIALKNYSHYRDTIEQLVSADADPNTISHHGQLPLAVALAHDDIDFITFLLKRYANPNLFVNPTIIDIDSHQETGSCAHIQQFEGKPAFYFAKNCKVAQLCLDYGAQANLKYCNYIHKDYGNVLTHVIDNKDYAEDLIPLYINAEKNSAGPYSTSYASYDGSTLHHVLHALKLCSNDTDAERLLRCAKHLLNKEPNLLTSQDHDGHTPSNCLALHLQHKNDTETFKKFAQLFDQYAKSAHIKNKSKE